MLQKVQVTDAHHAHVHSADAVPSDANDVKHDDAPPPVPSDADDDAFHEYDDDAPRLK